MIYFLILLVITFILYLGYGVIVDLTETDVVEKDAENKELLLHKLIKNKKYYFWFTYFLTTLIHVFLSIVLYLELYKCFSDMLIAIGMSVLCFVVAVVVYIFIPETTYRFIPGQRKGIELLLKALDLRIEVPPYGPIKGVIASKS